MELLYGGDIWAEFVPWKPFMESYHDWREHFRALIEELHPTLTVEIGSWYGASAIAMADIIKELELDCLVICIDTWLGSFEHWSPRNREQLMLVDGYPSVYYQFMSNVIRAGHTDVILPLPMISLQGMRWLGANELRPELIYVDGSHNEWDVFMDLVYADQILKEEGGIICGDDYYWDSVSSAVDKFARQHGYVIETGEERKRGHPVFWVARREE
jgi:hypothetical protein